MWAKEKKGLWTLEMNVIMKSPWPVVLQWSSVQGAVPVTILQQCPLRVQNTLVLICTPTPPLLGDLIGSVPRCHFGEKQGGGREGIQKMENLSQRD